MKYLKIKDNKNRQNFKKFELQHKLKYFLYKNLLSFINQNKFLSIKNKKLIFFQILKKKKKNFLTKIVRRCILTNRSKSFRPFKISRILTRELMSFGIIPGYTKAVW
jgi:ribosomal protein S14